MPELLRRVAVLTVLSAVGIALIAPLTARSAQPDATGAVEPLLDRLPLLQTTLERGPLAGRGVPSSLTLAVGLPHPAEAIAGRPSRRPPSRTWRRRSTRRHAGAGRACGGSPAARSGGIISGRASWYCHKAGTCPNGFTPADAFVALPGALGGAGGRGVIGYVTVCADRCVELPVVDYCGCYWGTDQQRVVDLSAAAWALVSDTPRSAGTVPVTVQLGS